MLFQPTNITPDVLGGAENGTVNADDGITVSWQVNGNSPLVAYRISISENNAASTSLYSSGIQTLATPIYPVNYKGEQQRCSFTIDATTLANAGITNGNEYKIGIRQFWDANNLDSSHSVRTISEPVFLTRDDAAVSITSPVTGTTIASYTQSFTAQYYQGASYSASATYDPIEWVRWRVYDSADRGRTIYDSQKIYTQELQLDYDGFLNGRTYVIILDIMNSVGQSATDTGIYDISWTAQTATETAVATKLNHQSSAVKVSWDAVEYTTGTPSGTYSIEDSKLMLGADGTVVWDETNGSPMSLDTDWVFVMDTVIHPTKDDPRVDIFKITTSNGKIVSASYDRETKLLSLLAYRSESATPSTEYMHGDDAKLRIIVNTSTVHVWKYIEESGLPPTASLTPSSSLTPTQVDEPRMFLVFALMQPGNTQANLTKIEVSGAQDIEFIEVVENATAEQIVTAQQWAANVSGEYVQTVKNFSNATFLADFNNGLDAGTYTIGGTAITGWDIYRKRKSEAFARHLCTLEIAQMSFLDYGCGSQQGKYTYFVYPRCAAGIYITSAIKSNTIKPVFWNWSIVEAEYDSSSDRYNVINEFIFRNNVSSGSISNNNAPAINENFTQYPTVQLSSANFQSGTLSGLIGQVGYTSYVVQLGNSLVDLEERFKTSQSDILSDNDLSAWDNNGYSGKVIKLFNPEGITQYFDDKQQRDLIWKLSTTTNHLFLKSRKGDVIEIKISGAITMETNDATRQQAITASIPWVQVDEAEDKTIICEA